MDQATNMETRLAGPVPQEPALAQSGSNVLRRHIKENPRKAILARHRLWLDSIPHEYPMPYTPYKIGVYIRYFNQTRHENYLEKHIQQYMDDIALCPQWTLVDFYVDKGMTAPHMEYSKEWCRLLEDCFTGKVNLIVTQKVSNVSSDWKEMTFMARMLAAQEHPVGIYFISEDMFCIYSKVLLDGICTVAPQIGAQDSCLLHGRLMKEQNAASFDMNDIETITEAE